MPEPGANAGAGANATHVPSYGDPGLAPRCPGGSWTPVASPGSVAQDAAPGPGLVPPRARRRWASCGAGSRCGHYRAPWPLGPALDPALLPGRPEGVSPRPGGAGGSWRRERLAQGARGRTDLAPKRPRSRAGMPRPCQPGHPAVVASCTASKFGTSSSAALARFPPVETQCRCFVLGGRILQTRVCSPHRGWGSRGLLLLSLPSLQRARAVLGIEDLQSSARSWCYRGQQERRVPDPSTRIRLQGKAQGGHPPYRMAPAWPWGPLELPGAHLARKFIFGTRGASPSQARDTVRSCWGWGTVQEPPALSVCLSVCPPGHSGHGGCTALVSVSL